MKKAKKAQASRPKRTARRNTKPSLAEPIAAATRFAIPSKFRLNFANGASAPQVIEADSLEAAEAHGRSMSGSFAFAEKIV